ncbi:hypothetical protein NW759_008247 [Fusarium solani]|nr:hypothetical protein NW759_008247 [Fusarium solani]
MPLPNLCSSCSGIFEGHYVPSNVLQERTLLALEGAAFVPSGFTTGTTEWRVRLDPGPGPDDPPKPYVHHTIQALEESVNACVLCAMIWLRLQQDIHPITLAELQQDEVVGIPAIEAGDTSYCGSFVLGICFSKVEGDKFVGRQFHSFRAFKAIKINADNRDTWRPKFDRQVTLERIRTWLESSTQSLNLAPRLPTRLLHCQASAASKDPIVKLVDTHELGSSTRYAALSHRWGEIQPLMLKHELVDAFYYDIPFTTIPATFQDAMKLANTLDIQYIWIDSLCIIQDSKEDWDVEAAHMASVYSQAYVTISATAAKDSSAGLKQDSMLKHPCEITPTWTGFEESEMSTTATMRLIDRSAFCDQVLSQPLFRRGWVFQEWILSPKTLHVASDQLWWTSASDMTSEGFASHETCEGFAFDVKRQFARTMPLGTLYLMGGKSAESLRPVWHQLLQDYLSRFFTFESDRLIAFAGIASLYQTLARVPPDSYLAGIWRQSLLRDLLWTVRDGRKVSPPQKYRVPSWSWASEEPTHTLSGTFGIGNVNLNADLEEDEEPWVPAAEVIEASVQTTGPELGSVSGGHLILQGPLIKARLVLKVEDLTGQFTPEQAAEFLPGGNLRYVRNVVTPTMEKSSDIDDLEVSTSPSKADLDDVFPFVPSNGEMPIYLGVLHCRVDLEDSAESYALALVRGCEKGEYRRIGYVNVQRTIMGSWIDNRDWGVFDPLTDQGEYLSKGDQPGMYNYRIV